jgi:hypothetical protein
MMNTKNSSSGGRIPKQMTTTNATKSSTKKLVASGEQETTEIYLLPKNPKSTRNSASKASLRVSRRKKIAAKMICITIQKTRTVTNPKVFGTWPKDSYRTKTKKTNALTEINRKIPIG